MKPNGRDLALAQGVALRDKVLAPMKSTFAQKDEIIDLLGVCLVAGENLFLLGPPGTAKSALVNDLARRLKCRSFEYLLTSFTEPNEIFGPFDIRKLREGDLVTNTEGMLPEAELVFLDELLNANSAILNSMLMVLNERVFRRGRETRKLPTLMVTGASNHLPEDEALSALFDRFLLRVKCDNVDPERLPDVLHRGWKLDLGLVEYTAEVSVDDIRQLHALMPEVDLGPVRESYLALVGRLRAAGIEVSDRRAVKLQRPIAASALLCGRTETRISDLWVLRHIWGREEQQEIVAALVDEAMKEWEIKPDDHPRANARSEPNPEALARDLETIDEELQAGTNGEPDLQQRSLLADQLSVLTSRSQWVTDQDLRQQLQEKIDLLWQKMEQPGDD